MPVCISYQPLVDTLGNTLGMVPVPNTDSLESCTGFVLMAASEVRTFGQFSFEDANQLIGATAGLFALAFVFRTVIKILFNR